MNELAPGPRPKPYRMSMQVVREHPIQRAITKMLTMELAPAGRVSRHGVCWYAIDHANYAGHFPAERISRGIVAGIADCFVLYRGRSHMLEIKADDGILSESQQAVLAAVLGSGGQVGVVRDPWETLACLDQWSIPRNRKVRVAA